MLQQAGTLESQGDYSGAAAVLVAVGHRLRAIRLFQEAGQWVPIGKVVSAAALRLK